MKDFRYLAGVTTLKLDREMCVGCGMCTHVCPHQVFALKQGKAAIIDRDGCMECGACTFTCPSGVPIVHLIRAAKAGVRRHQARKAEAE